MKSVTIMQMLDKGHYENILTLKADLIRRKNKGTIFFANSISSLPIDEPFEIYYHKSKGTITYDNAFPIPIRQYQPWKRSDISYLLPFYQSYYLTGFLPDDRYFQSLSYFVADKYIWFYKEGENNEHQMDSD